MRIKNVSETDVSLEMTVSDTRTVIGTLYYRQFFILQLLTFSYYVLLTLRDIISFEPDFGHWLVATDLVVVVAIILLSWLERIGVVHVRNVFLTPIPIAAFMMINIHVHVLLLDDMYMLLRGILVIMAFGIVSFLPWIFWLLVSSMTLTYAAMAWVQFPEQAAALLALGGGAFMVSYGGFAFRDNSIREQIRLNKVNLERAKAMEQLARAKEDFLANMSHELRTPLTGLMGMVDLLEEAPLRPSDKRHLTTARASAETLRVIIDDVLDFTKLDAGKLKLSARPFSLHRLVAEVTEMMAVSAGNKNIALIAKFDDEDFPVLFGDDARIRQILFNLVGNAIKFTDRGQILVSVKNVGQTDDTVSVRLSVEDTGMGIRPDDLNRLFDRFEQVDSSSTRGRSGTGLGLAISQQLASLMDAHIDVKSELGKGSVFSLHVTLPVSDEPPANTEANQTPKSEILIEEAFKIPARLLLAEDNPVNQMLLRKFLARGNWDVSVVSDGGEALSAASEQKFDLILLDIQMPVMTGEKVAETIKSGGGPNVDTPMVAITANCMPEDLDRYRSVGFSAHIAKPIDQRLFYETIASSLSGTD